MCPVCSLEANPSTPLPRVQQLVGKAPDPGTNTLSLPAISLRFYMLLSGTYHSEASHGHPSLSHSATHLMRHLGRDEAVLTIPLLSDTFWDKRLRWPTRTSLI